MKFFTILVALSIVGGVFIYTNSYARLLIREKAYLGATGVFLISLVALILPIYVLFFYKS